MWSEIAPVARPGGAGKPQKKWTSLASAGLGVSLLATLSLTPRLQGLTLTAADAIACRCSLLYYLFGESVRFTIYRTWIYALRTCGIGPRHLGGPDRRMT